MNPTDGPSGSSPQPGDRPERLDPQGKRALFEAPVLADRQQALTPGVTPVGKAALFSAGAPRPGTVLVQCQDCDVATRVGMLDLGIRLVSGSVWLPSRRHSHRMTCPACQKRTWCRVGWNQ